MPYRQSIETCFSDAIGPPGLEREVYNKALRKTGAALDILRAWKKGGEQPFLALPYATDDIIELRPIADRFREQFDVVIVLGTGGSSLGGHSLCALKRNGLVQQPGTPRLYFMDNVDPYSFQSLFDRLDAARCGVLAISKSGGTAETLVQTLCCLDWLQKNGAEPARHMTVISEATDNPLRRLAARHGLATLEHDPDLGGRYSVFSLVGLLPAMIAGVDVGAVRAGAATVLDKTLQAADGSASQPAMGAAMSVSLVRSRRITGSVLMPYSDRLAPFTIWFRQLWSESLGKDGQGTTPISALGTVDQHSQLQMFLDGPSDKMFTIIGGPGGGTPLHESLADEDPELAYLAGHSMGDLLQASQLGTVDALAAAGRPVRLISVDRVDEFILGALMMHFMLETVIAAHLFDVDPFTQPAVEDGKRRARQYLERMGKT